jgi:C-terminal processing protease CtpA/Prc
MNVLRPYRAELTAVWFWLATGIYLFTGCIEAIRFDVFLAALGTFGAWMYLALPPIGDKKESSYGPALVLSLGGVALLGYLHFFEINLMPWRWFGVGYLCALFALSLAVQALLAPSGRRPWLTLAWIVFLQVLLSLLFSILHYLKWGSISMFALPCWGLLLAALIHARVTLNKASGKRLRFFSESLVLFLLLLSSYLLATSIEFHSRISKLSYTGAMPFMLEAVYFLYLYIKNGNIYPDQVQILSPVTIVLSIYIYLDLAFDNVVSWESGLFLLVLSYVIANLAYIFYLKNDKEIRPLPWAGKKPPPEPLWLFFSRSALGGIRRVAVFTSVIAAIAYGVSMAAGNSMLDLLVLADYFYIRPIDRYVFAKALLIDKYVDPGRLDLAVLGKHVLPEENMVFDRSWDKFSKIAYEPDLIALTRDLAGESVQGEIGCLAACTNIGQAFVSHVFPDSAAEKAGLFPGDRLVEFNGKKAEKVFCSKEVTPEPRFLPGEIISLRVNNFHGESRTITITAERKKKKPLVDYKILPHGPMKIGYLMLVKFSEDAEDALNVAFEEFTREKIDHILIDLRYNTGGNYYLVSHMANMVVPSRYDRYPLAYFRENDRYKAYRYWPTIGAGRAQIKVDGITILTSNNTCSSSEMLILSLQPYIDVKVIGEQTCGKPFGTKDYVYDDIHIKVAEYEFYNADWKTYGVNGIYPDCPLGSSITPQARIQDDLTIKEAMDFIVEGKCPSSQSGVNHVSGLPSVTLF